MDAVTRLLRLHSVVLIVIGILVGMLLFRPFDAK
jgi:hypothetical protein